MNFMTSFVTFSFEKKQKTHLNLFTICSSILRTAIHIRFVHRIE